MAPPRESGFFTKVVFGSFYGNFFMVSIYFRDGERPKWRMKMHRTEGKE